MLDACEWRFGRVKRYTMGLRAHADAMAPNNDPLPIHIRGWSCQLVHGLYRSHGHIFHNSVLLPPHISYYSLPGLRFEVTTMWDSDIPPKPMTPSSSMYPICFYLCLRVGDSCQLFSIGNAQKQSCGRDILAAVTEYYDMRLHWPNCCLTRAISR